MQVQATANDAIRSADGQLLVTVLVHSRLFRTIRGSDVAGSTDMSAIVENVLSIGRRRQGMKGALRVVVTTCDFASVGKPVFVLINIA